MERRREKGKGGRERERERERERARERAQKEAAGGEVLGKAQEREGSGVGRRSREQQGGEHERTKGENLCEGC